MYNKTWCGKILQDSAAFIPSTNRFHVLCGLRMLQRRRDNTENYIVVVWNVVYMVCTHFTYLQNERLYEMKEKKNAKQYPSQAFLEYKFEKKKKFL